MSEHYLLEAQLRTETGRHCRGLRRRGFIPAVVYGHGFKPRTVSVPVTPFLKLYRAAGESSLIDLTLPETAPVKVLIQEIQMDPLRGDIIHVDFREVRMDEKLEAEISLCFKGEAPAVKELGGILVKNVTRLKVRCLPEALVPEIEIDLAGLKTFTDKIQVKEVALPVGMEVLAPPLEETVVLIEEPRSEEELKSLEAAPEVKIEEVKVATEEKRMEREKQKEGKEKGG